MEQYKTINDLKDLWRYDLGVNVIQVDTRREVTYESWEALRKRGCSNCIALLRDIVSQSVNRKPSFQKMTSTLMLAIWLLFLIPRPAVLRTRVRA